MSKYKWVPLGRTGIALQHTTPTATMDSKRETLVAILGEMARKLDRTRTRAIDPNAGVKGIQHALSMLQDLLTHATHQATRLE